MLRFTIRDLIWLLGTAALALGWFVDHRQVEAERAKHRDRAIEKEIALYQIQHALGYPCDQLDLGELQAVVNEAIGK